MATRRSSRLIQHAPAPVDDEDDECVEMVDADPYEESEPDVQTSKARRVAAAVDSSEEEEEYRPKKKPRKKKEKIGQLSHFPALPLDILYHISALLRPGDLLSLGRSCKSFRNLLFSVGSKPIWLAAMRAVEMPSLESPLGSEPALASLMYDKYCTVCDVTISKTMIERVDFNLRQRCCATCARNHLVASTSFNLPEQYRKVASACLLLSRPSPHKASVCFDADAKVILSRFKSLSTDLFKNQLMGKTADRDALNTFIAETKERHAMLARDGERLHDWTRKEARLRAEEAEAEYDRKSEVRRKKIESKFLGDPDLDINPLEFEEEEWLSHDDVYESRILTKKEWDRIQPGLLSLLEALREDRLDREMEERIDERYAKITSELYPMLRTATGPYAAFLPPFLPPTDSPWTLPTLMSLLDEDAEIDEPRWIASLPALLIDHNNNRRTKIDPAYKSFSAGMERAETCVPAESAARVLETGYNYESIKTTPEDLEKRFQLLLRVSSRFVCRGCEARGSFLEVSEHDCDHSKYGYGYGYMTTGMHVDARRVAAVWTVFEAAGVKEGSPNATEAYLDEFGRRFSCPTCCEGSWCRLDWRTIVEHLASFHEKDHLVLPKLRLESA